MHEVWKDTYHSIPVGSAQQASIFAEIHAGFANGTEEAMRLALSILAGTGAASSGSG